VTEEPIASVPAGSPADVDRAVAAARAAFDGGWATGPLEDRVEGLDAYVEPKAIGLPPALAGTLT